MKKKSLVDDNKDFEQDVLSPDVNQLKNLESLVNKANRLEKQIADMSETMDAWRTDLFKITRHLIPDAMGAAGVSQFTTSAGLKVSIKEFIEGALPKDEQRRALALRWLQENGAEDIIKGQIIVPFAKNQHNYKEEIKSALKQAGAEFKEMQEVHHSTLQAFARERIRKAEEVPLDILGLFAGRKAEIKTVDKKGQKL